MPLIFSLGTSANIEAVTFGGATTAVLGAQYAESGSVALTLSGGDTVNLGADVSTNQRVNMGAADTLNGIYVPSDSDPTGIAGCWVRKLEGYVTPEMYGLLVDSTDDQTNFIEEALKEKEFLKADLRGVDLSDTDLRGAVINTSQLQGADLHGANLEDVVAFSSRFDETDLSDANFTNAMLMQSRFVDARIEGTDFTNAVIDLTQMKALCGRASGVNSVSGVSTRESLGCR